jgi:TPP-dependent indolepyruvate ferredoxin oxidoreductase alpha subunit
MTNRIDQIIGQILADTGFSVVTCVPGSGCCSIFEAYHDRIGQKPLYSFHEEVAYTIAHGAGLAGARAATIIKAHGFAKAMNSVLDSLSAGTTAGFLVIICDDPTGQHSDSILQTEKILKGAEIPYRIPSKKNIYRDIVDAVVQSENLRLPVAVLLNSDEFTQQISYEKIDKIARGRVYQRDVYQHILCPRTAKFQREILEDKLSNAPWHESRTPHQNISFDVLPPHYQQPMRQFIPLFRHFKSIRGEFVTGDTGLSSLFAFPPYDSIDIVTFMGGSISLAIGIYLSGIKEVWAVTGDFAFIAAGHLGLLEAEQRQIALKVIICDNGAALATGGQPVAEQTIDRILMGYQDHVLRLAHPDNEEEIQSVLNKARKSDELQIIVANYRPPVS